jgi:hypothetical protein
VRVCPTGATEVLVPANSDEGGVSLSFVVHYREDVSSREAQPPLLATYSP